MPISKEKFFLGHSLVSNKVPHKVPLKDLQATLPPAEREVDLERLGLFEVSAPDFNKYYPDVTPEDLNPKDNEFAYPIFRALSNIIINKWGPIDFTTPGILKASTKKLIGQAVYTNHEQVVGNEVGVIIEAFWEDERSYDGFTVPSGINVKLKLDGKSNPKLVRNINSDPPSVHSVSVTVAFKWEKSHPELSDDDFWAAVGTYDDKGELIRRVVTEVFSYEEISLVSHGADPYAQKVNKDGKIVNPAYADNRYQFTADDFVENGHYLDWKNLVASTISLNAAPTIPNSNNNNNNSTKLSETMNKELLKLLRTQLGLAADAAEDVVLAKLQERLPVLLQAETELQTTKTQLADLKTKYPEGSTLLSQEDKIKLQEYPTLKATNEQVLKSLREEALKLYHLTVGGPEKADASITKLISEASFEASTALFNQYKAQAESKFQAKCESCGSTKVTRASASSAPEGVVTSTNGETGGTPTEKPLNEVLEEFAKPKSRTAGIHGETKPKV